MPFLFSFQIVVKNRMFASMLIVTILYVLLTEPTGTICIGACV
jgi:hypothetical protein